MSTLLKEAKRLYDLGLAVHWLHEKSKRPIESGWTTGPRKKWRDLEKTYRPGFNVGVRTGSPSKLTFGYLAVVDLDLKSKEDRHRAQAMAAIEDLLGDLILPMVSSGRGNGSRHYYGVTLRPFKTWNPAYATEKVKVKIPSKKPSQEELKLLSEKEIKEGYRLSRAWEISLYSEGRQVVLPPSIHPDSGVLYRWERPLQDASDLPLLSLPEEIRVRELASSSTSGDSGNFDHFVDSGKTDLKKPLAGFDFKVEPVDLSWLPISDEVRNAIASGTGVDDRSGYLLKASSALLSAGLSQNEILTVLTDPDTFLGACGYDHVKTKDRLKAAQWIYRYTLKKVSDEKSATALFKRVGKVKPPEKLTQEKMEAQALEFFEQRNWRQDLDRTKEGKIRFTLKNLDLIFKHAIQGPVFIEDLFASRIQYGVNTPWGGKAKSYIQDIDLIRVKRWLADTEFEIEPPTHGILEATLCYADQHQVHPVRDYLNGLKWDGVSRINTWIKDYCEGDALEPYLSEASRKFLLAMVKRVFEPGCQWDYVLVLEGKQGKYKSSIARALAGDKWFMDNLPDLKDKDSMLNLQGKWLIELGELADVKRADYNLVKAYLVRRTDTVRPHYGRLKSDVPRQSVFIGTINEGQYLKDPTGNRRYWPVKVGLCDVAGLLKVRDQLFAEAVHLYKTTDEILMMGEKASAQAADAQEERRVDDDETEMRSVLIDFIRSEKSDDFDFSRFRARALMTGPDAPWTMWGGKGYFMNTAAQVLSNLGFERVKIWGQRYWRMTEKTQIQKNRGKTENNVELETGKTVQKRDVSLFNNSGARLEKSAAQWCPGAPVDFDFF